MDEQIDNLTMWTNQHLVAYLQSTPDEDGECGDAYYDLADHT
jgi:hypothetical protein